MLMITLLGSLCAGAAEHQHIVDAIERCFATMSATGPTSCEEEGAHNHGANHVVDHGAVHATCPATTRWYDDNDYAHTPDDDVEDEQGIAPRMPCTSSGATTRRAKQPAHGIVNACVARPVKPAELKTNDE